MKKVVLVGVVALLGLASCKKDYTCECSVTSGGVTVSSDELEYTISNSTKSNATSECDDLNDEAEASVADLPNVTADCKLND